MNILNNFDFAPLAKTIIQHIDEGIIVANQLGKILYYNPAVIKLLGLNENTVLSKLNDIEKFNLQKSLLRAAIDSGEVEAAGKPSGNFVSFQERIKYADSNRVIEITSGLITDTNSKERKRLLLFRDKTDTYHIRSVLNLSNAKLSSKDPQMLEILNRIQQISPTNAFTLLQGESGTGKTQLARLIHSQSKRYKETFVELNCAAIPESLLESELFGHIKGAFTGASANRLGRFQTADKGTLFLDEVGEIPLHLQAKLLRAIQDQEFEMVGSDKTVKVNVRIIAASNQNLRDMVDNGQFRADLYYRLAVIAITVPALRDRPGDVPVLIKHFCTQLQDRGYPGNVECNQDSMRMMMNYPWPGNVRELENAVEHGIICSVDGFVLPESLPQDIREYCSEMNTHTIMSDDEEKMIEKIQTAMQYCSGNKVEAAKNLGVNRTTLWRWIQKYNIAV
ncbi:Response regulator of zinc sigma-54-dependent two-component system [hydrothermal vent metagenome]|uniref:Response regulator of zinc sigma-54-dependent two-component system n=1 Tax=hydrothermal vent metagenome TaxID=652676 RepID=A0A3B0WH38_9ZZZZ